MSALGTCVYFCGQRPATLIDELGNPCCLRCHEPEACPDCDGRGEMRSLPHGHTNDRTCRGCEGNGYADPEAAAAWEAAVRAEEATR